MEFFAYYIGLVLLWLTQITGSLGNAIIVFSILLKTLLLPIGISSQRQMDRMRLLQPKIKELKEKHKGDSKAFQIAQAELMKTEKVNPIAGCLPQIIQLIIMFMLYSVFMNVFAGGSINGSQISTQFYWLDLAKPDPYYIIPILAGLTQFVLSYMMLPKKNPNDTPVVVKQETKDENDFSVIGENMQRQMVFMLPVMTTFSLILFKLPSGLGLYWVTITIFAIVQQYFVSGLGEAEHITQKIPIIGAWLIKHQPATARIHPDRSVEEKSRENSQKTMLISTASQPTTNKKKSPTKKKTKKNKRKKGRI